MCKGKNSLIYLMSLNNSDKKMVNEKHKEKLLC